MPALRLDKLIAGAGLATRSEAKKLIRAGRLDPSFLITHRYALKDAMEAYELFEGKRDGVIKVALVP